MTVSKDNKRITITLNKELVKKIEKDALKENRSVSNLLANIIQEVYKK